MGNVFSLLTWKICNIMITKFSEHICSYAGFICTETFSFTKDNNTKHKANSLKYYVTNLMVSHMQQVDENENDAMSHSGKLLEQLYIYHRRQLLLYL